MSQKCKACGEVTENLVGLCDKCRTQDEQSREGRAFLQVNTAALMEINHNLCNIKDILEQIAELIRRMV